MPRSNGCYTRHKAVTEHDDTIRLRGVHLRAGAEREPRGNEGVAEEKANHMLRVIMPGPGACMPDVLFVFRSWDCVSDAVLKS